MSYLRLLFRRGISSNVPTKTGKSVKDAAAEATNKATRKGFYKHPLTEETYLNPDLTPPPRAPRTAEDFKHPERLGHWVPFGYDYTSKVADRYYAHEAVFAMVFFGGWFFYLAYYKPDLDQNDWARREAFLRIHKREALGLPLIDKNFIDPERIVLPSEEELRAVKFPVHY